MSVFIVCWLRWLGLWEDCPAVPNGMHWSVTLSGLLVRQTGCQGGRCTRKDLDFVLYSQMVQINSVYSWSVILSTGSPQSCVLSLFLFTLFTNDCTSHNPLVVVIKFSKDTALVGQRVAKRVHSRDQPALWLAFDDLKISVSKTKKKTGH